MAAHPTGTVALRASMVLAVIARTSWGAGSHNQIRE